LWCWGYNGAGELGVGDTDERTAPTQVGTDSDWSQVDVGADHTCAVRLNHTLWCWGWNRRGQLGLGDGQDRWLPTQVGFRTGWVSVSLGLEHTCAIRATHSLWCWGDNFWGQDGVPGTRKRHTFPQRVETPAGARWSQVSAGDFHTCAVRDGHTLWCWGYNQYGQLGLGSHGGTHPAPVQVGHRAVWAHVTAGGQDTCATRINQTLWCWGLNGQGQLGVGDTQDRYIPTQVGENADWADVSASYYHACAIRTDHSLWCWGLGYPLENDEAFPTQVGTDTDWASVFDGYTHTCGTRTDATLWCWGSNAYGQLGLGDHEDRNLPTQV
jgi:alpha-tubulin suppressor-like RCC1 family protein